MRRPYHDSVAFTLTSPQDEYHQPHRRPWVALAAVISRTRYRRRPCMRKAAAKLRQEGCSRAVLICGEAQFAGRDRRRPLHLDCNTRTSLDIHNSYGRRQQRRRHGRQQWRPTAKASPTATTTGRVTGELGRRPDDPVPTDAEHEAHE